jgi:hypothetical protein
MSRNDRIAFSAPARFVELNSLYWRARPVQIKEVRVLINSSIQVVDFVFGEVKVEFFKHLTWNHYRKGTKLV